MDNNKNGSYSVLLCLDGNVIDLQAFSTIIDKFENLFSCISDFVIDDQVLSAEKPIEKPLKVKVSFQNNNILFTIGSKRKNLTHEYMLQNLKLLLLCFEKNKIEEFKKDCHATVRYRVRELLQSVQNIGVSEIKIFGDELLGGEKCYKKEDIDVFLNNDDDFRDSYMPINVQIGMKYLEDLLSQAMSYVDRAGKKNRFYENPQFIFRGITQFYPSDKGVKKKIERIRNKDVKFLKELEYVKQDLIKSSLAVRIRDNSAKIIENKAYTRAHYVGALEEAIRKAKNMYPNKYTTEMSDLDILADIQHYGGATCLVDFSKNILTSIWFACSTDPNSNGFLYCYNVTEDMICRDALTQVRQEDEKRSIHDLLSQTYKETNVCSDVNTRFCLWEPSKKNNRIFRQDSVFLFGIEPFLIKEHAVYVIGIRAEWKQKILAAMKSIFNISGSTVYNDYVGFANNLDKKRPYRKMAESAYTRGYANMIQGNYWSAMEFLKLSEVDAYREDWDKRKLLELHFSLGVCYKGLGRQEKEKGYNKYYRENALLEYGKVIELVKDIVVANEANRDYYLHKAMRSYNARISMMYELGRYRDAILECRTVKDAIEKDNGLLKKYKSEKIQMTSKYCDVSILELEVLELLLHCKNQNEVKRIIKEYNWNKDGIAKIRDNGDKIDFWELIREYYNTLIGILYLKKETKKDIKKYINIWDIRAQRYFKCQETFEAKYIPWNFEDIKRNIDSISPHSFFYSKKEVLQDLTAGVISLRDTYEIYACWSIAEV